MKKKASIRLITCSTNSILHVTLITINSHQRKFNIFKIFMIRSHKKQKNCNWIFLNILLWIKIISEMHKDVLQIIRHPHVQRKTASISSNKLGENMFIPIHIFPNPFNHIFHRCIIHIAITSKAWRD